VTCSLVLVTSMVIGSLLDPPSSVPSYPGVGTCKVQEALLLLCLNLAPQLLYVGRIIP
jgi:hypothetical protein